MKLTLERTLRGWTQAELARRAGLHPSTVCQIEKGRFRPYPSQLTKLARALQVPTEQAASLAEEHPHRSRLLPVRLAKTPSEFEQDDVH